MKLYTSRLSAVEENPKEEGIRIDIEDLSRRLEVVESPTDAKNAAADPRVDEMAERLESLAKTLEEKGVSVGEGTSGGSLDVSGMGEQISKAITEGMKNAQGGSPDLKALKSQMYVVYFFIGMFLAVGVFLLLLYASD